MQAELFFSFFSLFKVLLLNISKTYSDSDCWETNLRVSPFKGDQHHAYHSNGSRTACNLLSGMPFLGVLSRFYKNRINQPKMSGIPRFFNPTPAEFLTIAACSRDCGIHSFKHSNVVYNFVVSRSCYLYAVYLNIVEWANLRCLLSLSRSHHSV